MAIKSYSVILSKKINEFNKVINVDSDKSISIRAFLIGSISQGVSKISNVLLSEDVFSTINCLKKLNCKIIKTNKNEYKIFGRGLGSYYAKKNTFLDLGNSGTGLRLMSSIISTTPNIEVSLTGDSSLKKRNMSKLITLLNEFGAETYPKNKINLPFKLRSSNFPVGIKYIAGNSAQLKSAAILAALNSFGTTTIQEKFKTRDHTENLLLKNSKSISFQNKKNIIKVFGKKTLRSMNIKVPSDPSSAAFFAAICILKQKSRLKIENVCVNQKRFGFYNILKKCGAQIKIINKIKVNNENVGDIIIKSGKIKSLKTNSTHYLTATDEYPLMFVIAALTDGTSKFLGIGELANKESNRIVEMKKILTKIGVKCKSTKNSMTIYGKRNFVKKNRFFKINSLNDHRIAMACAVLALCSGIKIKINGFETVNTSSPSFLQIIKKLGGKYEIKKRI